MPAISVLMPVFNTASYLRDSIESILNQTFGDFEFLIINDGSTDQSEDIILGYSDPRIKYIRNKSNMGLVYCLNHGLGLAEGHYIARMDSDDISLPHRFRLQFDYMERHPSVIVCGSAAEKFGEIHQVDKFTKDFLLCLLTSQFTHPCVFIRSQFLKSNGLRYDEESVHFEDYKLWVEIYKLHNYQSACFYNLPEVLLRYRVHSFQVSSRFRISQSTGAVKLRRKTLVDFLQYHHLPFRFTENEFLNKADIVQLEKLLTSFEKHKPLLERFSIPALEEFKALTIYWLYISFAHLDFLLLIRFLILHFVNPWITLKQKIQVILHLATGRKYKRRF